MKENSGKSLMDFQVLVGLTPANFAANAKSGGADSRFLFYGNKRMTLR